MTSATSFFSTNWPSRIIVRTAGKSASIGMSRTAPAGSRALLTRKSALVRAATAASLSWATS